MILASVLPSARLDLQGPKLRIGTFAAGPIRLEAGAPFQLDLKPAAGDGKRVCLPHPEIFAALRSGTDLPVDDGKLPCAPHHARPAGNVDQTLVSSGYKARLGAPALNTLVHRIAVLSKAHRLAKQPNPCADPLVRELLAPDAPHLRRAPAQAARAHQGARVGPAEREDFKLLACTYRKPWCDRKPYGSNLQTNGSVCFVQITSQAVRTGTAACSAAGLRRRP